MSPEQLAVIDAYAPRFREATAGMPYIRRGVFWSELLAFSALARHAGAWEVIESGTGLGFSASVMAKTIGPVYTYGLEPSPWLDGERPAYVYFEQADSLPCLGSAHEECAVLIDGPKNEKSIEYAKVVEHSSAAILGVHDVQKGSTARRLMEEAFPTAWYTDDMDFVMRYGHMDRECLAMAAGRGKTFVTHGPTMGIVVL